MVSEQREIGDNCKIGENVKFVGSVKIGNNCKIGNNVYLNSVSIDHDAIIQDNVVIGYDTITGHFYDQEKSNKTKINSDESKFHVVVGKNVLIRNGAVIYSDVQIGNNCWINHNAIIRENVKILNDCTIGSNTICENNVSIGNRCAIHNNTMICAETSIESCVFIGPGVSFTNNSPIGHLRNVPATIRGAKLRFGCAIGGGATICPGVEIGSESIVAAGTVVTKDVSSRIIVVGNPAKKIKDVEDESLIKEDIRKAYENEI
jgi:acetyltransferase-like isoleucine patch superfamily enzyme|tara:strand:- start:42 stop:824 length:783 start_codon:yes stop_codon:yes gene_type:complete